MPLLRAACEVRISRLSRYVITRNPGKQKERVQGSKLKQGNGISFTGRNATWTAQFDIYPLFSYSHPRKSFPSNVAVGKLLMFMWTNVEISILKYPKINLALCFNRIMLLYFAFSLFRCSDTICSVWSSSQSASQHCITLISMYLYVKNPSGEYLRSFTLGTHTLLICFSLSLTVLFYPRSLSSRST